MIRATPLLEEMGMRATMLVPTVHTRQWGSFFLKQNEIRKVSAMPHWSVGSMGHEAVRDIDRGSGRMGRFLTVRQPHADREEADEEFMRRVVGDYATSRQILADATGLPPLLYVYPYADTGTGPDADRMAASMNRIGVTNHYAMAITRADHSFNGPATDPYALSRLRASGLWSGDQLVARLQRDQPRQSAYGSPHDEDSWLRDFDADVFESQIVLNRGSAVWLRGTENWDDVDAQAEVQGLTNNALLALYARHSGPQSFVRLTVNENELVLQEQLPSGIQALARRDISIPHGEAAHIRLRIRNNRAWIYLNGQEAGRSLPLAKTTRSGRVGLGADFAAARVSQFAARPLPAYWIEAEAAGTTDNIERPDVKSILAPWHQFTSSSEQETAFRASMLQSSANGMEVIPVASTSTQDMRELITWLGSQGLRPLVHHVAVHSLDPDVAGILVDAGMEPVFMVEAGSSLPATDWMSRNRMSGYLLIKPGNDTDHVPVDLMSRTLPTHRIFIFSHTRGLYVPAREIGLNGSGG